MIKEKSAAAYRLSPKNRPPAMDEQDREKTGHKAETQAHFDLLNPYDVLQFVRSGTVAISKSRQELLTEYLEKVGHAHRTKQTHIS